MDHKRTNQLIGYAVLAIIAYYVLQMIIPFLIYGVIALVIWRVYQEYQNHKIERNDMADYFTNFSFILPLKDKAQKEYAAKISHLASRNRFGDEPMQLISPNRSKTKRKTGRLNLKTAKTVSGCTVIQAGLMPSVLLSSTLAAVQPVPCVSFEWSHDCSKPRIDAYGGVRRSSPPLKSKPSTRRTGSTPIFPLPNRNNRENEMKTIIVRRLDLRFDAGQITHARPPSKRIRPLNSST